MNTKITKSLIIVIASFLILFFIFNPFYWLMKPIDRAIQPKLSLNELSFFEKLEKKCKYKIKRNYYNYTSEGLDTLYLEKYNRLPFTYSLSIDMPNECKNDLNEDSLYFMSKFIKKNILENNKMLKKIIIYKNYDSYKYDIVNGDIVRRR